MDSVESIDSVDSQPTKLSTPTTPSWLLNVELLNATVNILYKSISDEQHYKLMEAMLPRTKYNDKYIKAEKKQESVKSVEVVDISQTFEESSSKIEESLAFVLGEK